MIDVLIALALGWAFCAIYAVRKLYLHNPAQWGTALILGFFFAPFFAIAELTRNRKD